MEWAQNVVIVVLYLVVMVLWGQWRQTIKIAENLAMLVMELIARGKKK
jgi:hypothetical protein